MKCIHLETNLRSFFYNNDGDASKVVNMVLVHGYLIIRLQSRACIAAALTGPHTCITKSRPASHHSLSPQASSSTTLRFHATNRYIAPRKTIKTLFVRESGQPLACEKFGASLQPAPGSLRGTGGVHTAVARLPKVRRTCLPVRVQRQSALAITGIRNSRVLRVRLWLLV